MMNHTDGAEFVEKFSHVFIVPIGLNLLLITRGVVTSWNRMNLQVLFADFVESEYFDQIVSKSVVFDPVFGFGILQTFRKIFYQVLNYIYDDVIITS